MAIRTLGSLFLFALGIFAQSGGAITGTAVDVAGDPVPNAEIQATNAATKAVFKATTSSAGVYTFAELPAGTYDLTNSSPGFTPFVQHGVVVSAGQNLAPESAIERFPIKHARRWPRSPRRPELAAPGAGRANSPLAGWQAGPFRYMAQPRTIDPGKPEMKPWAEAVLKERAETISKTPQVALPAAGHT
jgi:hypothetical protein